MLILHGTYLSLVSEESSPSFYPMKQTMVVMGLNSGFDLGNLQN
jgi:hypothetical protein